MHSVHVKENLPKAAATPDSAIRLCPQACPTTGKASYPQPQPQPQPQQQQQREQEQEQQEHEQTKNKRLKKCKLGRLYKQQEWLLDQKPSFTNKTIGNRTEISRGWGHSKNKTFEI